MSKEEHDEHEKILKKRRMALWLEERDLDKIEEELHHLPLDIIMECKRKILKYDQISLRLKFYGNIALVT